MRVVFCTSGGLYGNLVLRRLLAADGVEVAGIVRSTRILSPRYGWLRGALGQLRRSGPAYALYLWTVTDLAELLAAATGTGWPSTLARRQGIPLLATRDLNRAEGLAFLAERAPDLLVSAFFNQRVGAAARGLAPLGAVNLHPGRLPAFRGVDPVFFARLRGEDRLGVSLHRMAEEFDTGPLLAEAVLEPKPGESLLRATARLFERGAGLLLENLEPLRHGLTGVPQAAGGAYDSWPTPAEVAALAGRGVRLVEWQDLRQLLRHPAGPWGP